MLKTGTLFDPSPVPDSAFTMSSADLGQIPLLSRKKEKVDGKCEPSLQTTPEIADVI